MIRLRLLSIRVSKISLRVNTFILGRYNIALNLATNRNY